MLWIPSGFSRCRDLLQISTPDLFTSNPFLFQVGAILVANLPLFPETKAFNIIARRWKNKSEVIWWPSTNDISVWLGHGTYKNIGIEHHLTWHAKGTEPTRIWNSAVTGYSSRDPARKAWKMDDNISIQLMLPGCVKSSNPPQPELAQSQRVQPCAHRIGWQQNGFRVHM